MGAVLLADHSADGLADLAGLLGGGGLAGADGPQGLVGDDHMAHLLGGHARQGALHLIGDKQITASMIKEAGAKYVIIGHSERRQYYNETDLYFPKYFCTGRRLRQPFFQVCGPHKGSRQRSGVQQAGHAGQLLALHKLQRGAASTVRLWPTQAP